MSAQNWIAIAAVNGFMAVVCGAYGAHGLKRVLVPASLRIFETASYYQLTHALLLGLLGVLMQQGFNSVKLQFSAWACVVGIVLFSGSLYALSLSEIKMLGLVTPLGGAAFLISWALLVYTMVTK